MKTNVEVLESGATKLTVTIEAADIDRRIKKTYKDFGTKYRFPGFRPGHVPRPVIDSHMGKDAVRGQVTDELINEAAPLAIDECDLYPITDPKFNDVDDFVVEGKDFVFSLEFEVKPELELSDYSPLHVEVPFATASEAEIDEQVKGMADYYAEYKNANANTKVKADSTIQLTLTAKDSKGEDIPQLAVNEVMYTLGSGVYPPALDEALVGKKKGESVTVTVSANGSDESDENADTITLDATVVVVKKKETPEVTDEWVKEKLGGESVEKLREQMASMIEQQKASMIPAIRESNALYALQERLEGEVPEAMVKNAREELYRNFFMQLQRQGATLDMWLQQMGLTPDKFKEDVSRQAEDKAKQDLALDAWARKNGIVVTDEEVENEFKTSGAKDPEKMYADWKARGELHVVREGIMRDKALISAIESAEIVEVEKAGSAEAEEKPAKKTSKKKAAKKEEAPAEEAEASEAE